jgi:dTDP-4-amino-4,6-dideoxygalactose transaminase
VSRADRSAAAGPPAPETAPSKPVPLLDLVAQHRTIAAEVEAAVLEVLRDQRCILGERGAAFERAIAGYLGVEHAIGVASGSDALLLALMTLDVGAGDEVLTTPFSFFATAASVVRLGATPVFADVGPDDLNLDPRAAEAAVTRQTRVLLPVHLYGQCADVAALEALARQHRLPIVEDAAQAIGASRAEVRAGAWGDVACFSFYPTKNLGAAGDAGLVTTADDRLAERLRRLRAHGATERYLHLEVGINSRLDEVQAAVLAVKLKYVDGWCDARARHARRYDALFRDARLEGPVRLPVVHPGARHVFHQYVVRADRRDELRAHLRARGIGCEVYYPVPLHLQPCFDFLGYRRGDFPEAERAANEVLALPIYPELTPEQQERVVETIAEFYSGRSIQ